MILINTGSGSTNTNIPKSEMHSSSSKRSTPAYSSIPQYHSSSSVPVHTSNINYCTQLPDSACLPVSSDEDVPIKRLHRAVTTTNTSVDPAASSSRILQDSSYSVNNKNTCSVKISSKTDELIADILPGSKIAVYKMNLRHASIDKTIEDTIKSTWNKIIGTTYNILIAYITKVDESLGISLQGTVDVDDVTGLEDRPRHYLRTITSGGPVGLSGIFKPGDELLEVNGKKLYGVGYAEVLNALKTLPNRVQIVCARRKELDLTMLSRSSSTMIYDEYIDPDDDEDGDDNQILEEEINISSGLDINYHSMGQYQNICKTGKGSVLCHSEAIRKGQMLQDGDEESEVKDNASISNYDPMKFPSMSKAKSDNCLFIQSERSLSHLVDLWPITFNRSLQYLRDVAMWSGPILVELDKAGRGLGFSIDYYQEVNAAVPVTVISSLVPNGVAHVDGRIIPGHRLLFINEVDVDSLPSKLDVVECLRALPPGKVLLGIAKPMFPSNNMYRSYSKETVDELSDESQSLNYEPLSVTNHHGNTTNQPPLALAADFNYPVDIPTTTTTPTPVAIPTTNKKLYQMSTCIVQQTLHNAGISLKHDYDLDLELPCVTNAIANEELNSNQNPIRFSNPETMSNLIGQSDLIGSNSVSNTTINSLVTNNNNYSNNNNNSNKLNKPISEHTSSNTASTSDINSSSSIDCLDELEVTKVSESDTDTMFQYWKKTVKSPEDTANEEDDKEITLDRLKQWCFVDFSKSDLSLDTTKWCGIGYPLLNTQLSYQPYQQQQHQHHYGNHSAAETSCRYGDIITDINGHNLAEFRPANIQLLLNELIRSHSLVKVGYLPAEEFHSPDWLKLGSQPVETQQQTVQRTYHCFQNEEDPPQNLHQWNKTQEEEDDDDDDEEPEDDEPAEDESDLDEQLEKEHLSQTNSQDQSVNIQGWSVPRQVVIYRHADQNLGISILGGKVANVVANNDNDDDFEGETETNLVSGIFVTHVSPGSPADQCGKLNIGDRLLSVNGFDLIKASYEDAINFIKTATSPITFTIQSLIDMSLIRDVQISNENIASSPDNPINEHEQEPGSLITDKPQSTNVKDALLTPPNTPNEIVKQEHPHLLPAVPAPSEEEEHDKENSISVSSLSNDESLTAEISELGTNPKSSNIDSSSNNLAGSAVNDVHEFIIQKQNGKGLGLMLVGNKDCQSMNCYICGFKDNSVALDDGRLNIGDELLKINSIDVNGMSHSNVAPIIKKCQSESNKISLTIRRRLSNLDKMACVPGSVLAASTASARKSEIKNNNTTVTVLPTYSQNNRKSSILQNLKDFGEIHQIHLEKSTQGFGFFIMDGNVNDEMGIYVKKITSDGIAAKEGTLKEGDRILLINTDMVVEEDYDTVLKKLRSCSTHLDMIVGRMHPNEAIIPAPPPQQHPIELSQNQQEKMVDISPHVVLHSRPVVDMTDEDEERNNLMNHPPPLTSQLVASPQITSEDPLQRRISQQQQKRSSFAQDSKEPIYTRISPDRKRNSSIVSNSDQNRSATAKKVVSLSNEKPQEINTPALQKPGGSLTQKEHPTKAQIVPGVETVIELTKDRGLGLSIIGGSDTILGTVMIHEVHENEAAAKDGRLWAGDKILAVNGKDLRNANHDQAIQALRSVGSRVRLKILRDPQPLWCEDSIYFKLKVDLMKKSKKGLGICIVSKNDVGVCISDLVKGSVAEQDGRLKKGDLLLEINEINVRGFSQDQVAALLKKSSGNISLMIGRLRSSIASSDTSTSNKNKKKR